MHTTDLAFRITDTWRAAFVPTGVLAAGIITLIGVILTLRNTRTLAHDERLWERRAALYVEVITQLRETDTLCTNNQVEILMMSGPDHLGPTLDRTAELLDQLETFGTPKVLELYRLYRAAIFLMAAGNDTKVRKAALVNSESLDATIRMQIRTDVTRQPARQIYRY